MTTMTCWQEPMVTAEDVRNDPRLPTTIDPELVDRVVEAQRKAGLPQGPHE